jgi:hypothetical protein
MGIFKNRMGINPSLSTKSLNFSTNFSANKSQNYLNNTDAHFLNRNYGRTGRADAQTDQQHSTSRVIC